MLTVALLALVSVELLTDWKVLMDFEALLTLGCVCSGRPSNVKSTHSSSPNVQLSSSNTQVESDGDINGYQSTSNAGNGVYCGTTRCTQAFSVAI